MLSYNQCGGAVNPMSFLNCLLIELCNCPIVRNGLIAIESGLMGSRWDDGRRCNGKVGDSSEKSVECVLNFV